MFSADTHLINVPGTRVFTFAESFTVVFWYYKTADYTSRNTIFEKSSTTSFETNVAIACHDNVAVFTCDIVWKTNHTTAVTGDSPTFGEWVNVIFISRNESNTSRISSLYIDGLAWTPDTVTTADLLADFS